MTEISKLLVSLKTSRQRLKASQRVGWARAEVQERKMGSLGSTSVHEAIRDILRQKHGNFYQLALCKILP